MIDSTTSSHPPATLVLWDIDGTLVTTDRAGERALLEIIRQLYGRDLGPELPVDLRGRTDTSIMRDLFAFLKQDGGAEEQARFQAAYLAGLKRALPLGRGRTMPGIPAAVAAIAKTPYLHQALLTGNLLEGARLKLTHLELWHYFEFGAFADDSSIRDELGPFALRRAREKLGIDFPPDRVFIIGDTPHDIACGRAIGARTIAVATGSFSVPELEAFHPNFARADLTDTADFLKLLSS